MPIYEFECPQHSKFEIVQSSSSERTFPCPQCGRDSPRVISRIAQVKVIHTEKLPHNARERVEDRQRLMRDTAVKKALTRYAEESKAQPYSPYR